MLPHIAGGDELAGKMTPALREQLMAAMPGLKERAKTLVELFEASRFVWASRPLALDDKAKALLTPEAKDAIGTLLPELEAVADWTASGVETIVRGFAERTGASSARWRSRCARRSPAAPPRRRFSTCWRCWAPTRASPGCATRPAP